MTDTTPFNLTRDTRVLVAGALRFQAETLRFAAMNLNQPADPELPVPIWVANLSKDAALLDELADFFEPE